ncbi:MAG TPA: helix-turn-helix domain-containing protein [Solirubrobacteraceae bacterium]|nr:helix-turn-helix domain-containing protein [Solirubrobacteraceae bacterium]
MEGEVKPRRYRSERRREQAEQTRRRIIGAAAKLFEERGYEGASIAAIAEEAGVSQETVYARFRNKRTLLGELVRGAVRGDDPAPVPQQAGPRAIAAATDQREQLRLFAADIVLRLERAAPVVAIVAGASRSEPELAELLARLHADRLRNLRVLVHAVAGNGPLRLGEDAAVETVWALTSPELHQLLSRVRGWTRRRYRDWLADSLAQLLLPESGRG